MKTTIFMNHHIKDPKTTEPVITVMKGGQAVYTNKAEIVVDGRVVAVVRYRADGRGSGSRHHHVRAWIETSEHIKVL